jgi:hypothetical protein
VPIVAVELGQKLFLSTFLGAVPLKVGLFKNDRTPRVGDTIAAYTEADFSGYAGRKDAVGWTAPIMSGGHAVSQANSLSWRQNGGATSNNIYGVFYVDAAGDLLFAERDPRAPVLVDPDHRGYTFRPVLTDTSEFSP